MSYLLTLEMSASDLHNLCFLLCFFFDAMLWLCGICLLWMTPTLHYGNYYLISHNCWNNASVLAMRDHPTQVLVCAMRLSHYIAMIYLLMFHSVLVAGKCDYNPSILALLILPVIIHYCSQSSSNLVPNQSESFFMSLGPIWVVCTPLVVSFHLIFILILLCCSCNCFHIFQDTSESKLFSSPNSNSYYPLLQLLML
jgi:hypothetical protein